MHFSKLWVSKWSKLSGQVKVSREFPFMRSSVNSNTHTHSARKSVSTIYHLLVRKKKIIHGIFTCYYKPLLALPKPVTGWRYCQLPASHPCRCRLASWHSFLDRRKMVWRPLVPQNVWFLSSNLGHHEWPLVSDFCALFRTKKHKTCVLIFRKWLNFYWTDYLSLENWSTKSVLNIKSRK